MGKSGPKAARHDGYHVTAKGYLRGTHEGRHRLQHDVVWDKLDNRIENLVSVDTGTHKRLHSGCKLIDGKWWKRCTICTLYRPLDLEWWYFSKEGWPLYGRCRPCHIARVVSDKKLRRLRARGEAAER
jgi:hypothetical protein